MSASVTIGIPFFNAKRHLTNAVRSVFAQTYTDWELILMDDGSDDGSTEIAARIDHPRVRFVTDGVNRGLCARLNQLTALARGSYLARMDADDLMHPRRIERQQRFLDDNPDIDVIDTATYTIDDDLTPLGIRGDLPLDSRPETVLCRGLLIHPTVMGRTAWFRSHAYDPAFVRAEDRELWSRTCMTTRFGRLREPLFFYREGSSGHLRNYLRTEATVRKILLSYGPPLVGSHHTRLLVLRSYLKALTYSVATRFNLQGRLIAGRNRPLDAATVKLAETILADIAGTPVPGLECAAQLEKAVA
jgi:glycosyltransferase involved in cell wall biosynthesis